MKYRKIRSVRFIISIVCIFFLTTHALWVDFWPFKQVILAFKKAPADFGKKHFIVGYHHEQSTPTQSLPSDVPKKRSQKKYSQLHGNSAILFSPDDDVRSTLLDFIDREQTSIKIAIFSLTEPAIAKALSNACKRGVMIEIITDPTCLRDIHNKIGLLCNEGCIVRVYNPAYGKRSRSSCMHHKFALFYNVDDVAWIWTGSFNFTVSASIANQENVIVMNDRAIFDSYAAQFEKLKLRSHAYGH